MKKLPLFILLILISACFPSFESSYEDRCVMNTLYFGKASFELYEYRAAFAESPSYIVLKTDRLDTLCIVTNIVKISKDSTIKKGIVLHSGGYPKMYTTQIHIPNEFKVFSIRIDSTYRPVYRDQNILAEEGQY